MARSEHDVIDFVNSPVLGPERCNEAWERFTKPIASAASGPVTGTATRDSTDRPEPVSNGTPVARFVVRCTRGGSCAGNRLRHVQHGGDDALAGRAGPAAARRRRGHV